jgi:hypothetical protein
MANGGEAMINPQEMYRDGDAPSRNEKKSMWRIIRRGTAQEHTPLFFIRDRRSFAYGLAAAFVLYFASVGAWQVVKQNIEAQQPAELKVDQAYRSAINALERILPVVLSNQADSLETAGLLSSRQEQMQLLDVAIAELRRQTGTSDLSPALRARLRQLYSLKLNVLQQMIERGEIEL